MRTPRRSAWVGLLLGAFCCLGSGAAQGVTPGTLPVPHLNLLVKNTVWNELQARKHRSTFFEYREVDQSPQSSTTSQQIETPHGTVVGTTELDGEPLSAAQRRKTQRQLQKLAHNSRMQSALLAGQRQQTAQRMGLFKDFPSAFIFQYDGTEANGVLRLTFRPNPKFHPLSSEDLALRGMSGTMWVDPRSQRLVKIDGTLIRDVTLGWGVVVRLNRGGHFVMQQSEVGPNAWRTTLLAVDLTGKILLVKTLKVHFKQSRSDFTRVADNLTIPRAVAMLCNGSTGP